MKLENKYALIPGASRPVGRAVARRFAKAGAFLILPVFDWPDSIREMEDDFSCSGFSFFSFPADLRNEKEVKKLIQKISEKTTRMDFLINNIERGGMPVVHGSYDHPHNSDQWDTEIDTTLRAKWLLFHHCLPLLKNSSHSSVLNISSIAAVTGRSGPGGLFFNDGFSAANRAISSFTQTWARELCPSGRVNELMLGLVDSRHGPGTRGWEILTEKERDELKDHILLDRFGTPEEVAKMAFFLAAKATYLTGATIKMDGGFSLGGDTVPPMPEGILS
jgi:3-oxoacyl-[acyl-carrier protein] reductase